MGSDQHDDGMPEEAGVRAGRDAFVAGRDLTLVYHFHNGTWFDSASASPLVAGTGKVAAPYRGLNAFGERDQALFFGRERAVSDVLRLLSERATGPALIVVSGASGAGKSSLLRAGVVPKLRENGLGLMTTAASWPCLVLNPTASPLDELANGVATILRAPASAWRRELNANPACFAAMAQQAALLDPAAGYLEAKGEGEAPQRRLLLIVDQCEKLFAQCGERERRAFLTALYAASTAEPRAGQMPPAMVVLSIRADFEARLAGYDPEEFPGLGQAVQDRYLVRAMDRQELRMAITEPAARAGARVQEDLVRVLLSEMRPSAPADGSDFDEIGAGSLPLLSHALDQAWRARAGHDLTMVDYERTGGVRRAVALTAQAAYEQLTKTQRKAARSVFIRLVNTSEEGVDTAARVWVNDLIDERDLGQTADVAAVLEAFAARRLLTLGAGTVEISHEILLTGWPLLHDTWLAETYADRTVRTRLRATAGEWLRWNRDSSYLYRGTLLQAAVGIAAKVKADPERNPPLGQEEREFLKASRRAVRRTSRWGDVVTVLLVTLTLAAVIVAGLARLEYDNANRQHAITLSRQLVAESITIEPQDPITARQLAIAAWHAYPTDAAGSRITALLAEQQTDVLPTGDSDDEGPNGVAFSPDGRLLATPGANSRVRLWDLATGQLVRSIFLGAYPPGILDQVAFSPGGLLATVDNDGRAQVWEAATGRLVWSLPSKYEYPTVKVSFGSSGLLAVSGNGSTVQLWDPDAGRLVRTLTAGPATWQSAEEAATSYAAGVAFGPNGLLATTTGDGTVRVWDSATGQLVKMIHAPSIDSKGAMAFGPGSLLAIGGTADGRVRLWNVTSGHLTRSIAAGPKDGEGYGLAFNPSGLLATGQGDGSVRLWDSATGRLVRTIAAKSGAYRVTGVAFGPNGRLAATSSNGMARVWDSATGLTAGTSLTVANGAEAMAFSPGGLLATADVGGVEIWNPAVGRRVKTLKDPDASGLAFSSSGLLATADTDGAARVWNPSSGQLLRTFHATVGAGNDSQDPFQQTPVYEVAFGRGGLLATAEDGTVRVWNSTTGRLIRTLDSDISNVSGIAFSSKGLVAVAYSSGIADVTNPLTGRLAKSVSADKSEIQGVAFSPDGLLATADWDGTARVWNPITGQLVSTLTTTADTAADIAPVDDVAYGPTGLLATADDDGTAQVWNPIANADASANVPIIEGTSEDAHVEKVAFSPEGTLIATIDDNDVVHLWATPLFANANRTLCADVGALTRDQWFTYAPGEPYPKLCA